MEMDLVFGTVVITSLRDKRMALVGEEFLGSMRKAIFSPRPHTRGRYKYIFAKPKESKVDDQTYLYSEIAEIESEKLQMKIDWDAKDYEKICVQDCVERRWPFVISSDRDIAVQFFKDPPDFLKKFEGIFRALCEIGGEKGTTARPHYWKEEADVFQTVDSMQYVSRVNLKGMKRANPVEKEDYLVYDRLLEQQGATGASTEFESEEENGRGLNVKRGSLLRSGLAGAEVGFGDWEVEGILDKLRRTLRKGEKLLKVHARDETVRKGQARRITQMMIEALEKVKRWKEK